MKTILFFVLLPLHLFCQTNDSIVLAIDKEISFIENSSFYDKLVPDTLAKINDEYDQQYIVALYNGKFLKKVRIDLSDGAAGDISSGLEYYFKNGELIMIISGTSYFMANGCGVIEKLYFSKNDFIKLISTTDCKGENAKTVHDYVGSYGFGLDGFLEEYKKYMKDVKLEW